MLMQSHCVTHNYCDCLSETSWAVTFLAQCNDGASMMSGHVTGVQTRVREVHWSAVVLKLLLPSLAFHCHVFLSQCDFNVLLYVK